ncbi:MAG: recombinase family protein [Treponema sp.]|jgi:DNA invertase Pin-like site-specific DNA recombinase|nr:recombinase family protein [Treponema sp.]
MGREMTDEEKREYDQLTANMEQMRLRLEELEASRPDVYGYARVSTYGQARGGNSLEAQEAALKAAGAQEIYIDMCTGTKLERPEFDRLRADLRAGDTLIVTKLDRFARTVGQASELITDLIDSGVTVNVLNLGILSNDSMSVLLRNILLSFAQFERDMIVERTQEGKAIARQKEGFRDGRPKKYGTAQMDHAMELLKENSYNRVVEMTGISRATLAREKSRRAAEGRTS